MGTIERASCLPIALSVSEQALELPEIWLDERG